jgi:hypothetical protein
LKSSADLESQIISELELNRVARTCHEVNRAYCATIGDFSQKSWEDTRKDIQQSAISGVVAFILNPNATPEMSHAGWSNFKIADGWVYGPIKDLDNKTHPCLVPYSELPEAQRAKDSFFLTVCRALLT